MLMDATVTHLDLVCLCRGLIDLRGAYLDDLGWERHGSTDDVRDGFRLFLRRSCRCLPCRHSSPSILKSRRNTPCWN